MTHTSFICFIIGYCFAFNTETHNTFFPLVVLDSFVIIALLLFYILLLLKGITKKNSMVALSYLVLLNVIISSFLFMNRPNFEANISYGVNIILILLFIMPFTVSISQALLFNLISFLFIPVLAIISGEVFLWNRWPSNLLFLNGIGITCVIFSKLITRFLKSAIESRLQIQELSYFKQKITRHIIHDLKVPASTILNLSNDKKDRAMSEINTQIRTINKQLEDVLDIERLEEPTLFLNIQEIAIDKIVEQSIYATENLALNKNIQIDSIFKVHGYLKCDINLIERTLINLLINAIKYSPANEQITIIVETQNKFCCIAIKDKGIGIPPEHLTKIFDKFYRVQSEKSGDHSSSGLGLAFCKLAIQAHEGQIKVLSGAEYGVGSSFEILLPNFTLSHSKKASTKEYKQSVSFTPQEKMQITNICHQISNIPIYNVSEIMHLTKNLSTSSSANLSQWNKKFTEAIYTGNQDYLNEILEPFLKNEPDLNHSQKH